MSYGCGAAAAFTNAHGISTSPRSAATILSIGKAAAYTLGNWPKLIRFVDDARIPLDNNATARGIRGPVVGRRNHFGSKSRGTEVAATLCGL